MNSTVTGAGMSNFRCVTTVLTLTKFASVGNGQCRPTFMVEDLASLRSDTAMRGI
jgi:hypothetical protein